MNKEEIRCLICNNYLKESYPTLRDDSTPEHSIYHNAIVFKTTAAYGSSYDTSRLVMGLCDHCIKQKVESGQIIDRESFLETEEFKQEQQENLKKMEEDGTLEKLDEISSDLKAKRELKEKLIEWLENE